MLSFIARDCMILFILELKIEFTLSLELGLFAHEVAVHVRPRLLKLLLLCFKL